MQLNSLMSGKEAPDPPPKFTNKLLWAEACLAPANIEESVGFAGLASVSLGDLFGRVRTPVKKSIF